jgi:hypothetical protein
MEVSAANGHSLPSCVMGSETIMGCRYCVSDSELALGAETELSGGYLGFAAETESSGANRHSLPSCVMRSEAMIRWRN